jgi:outer membrane protein TolC
VGCSSGPKYRIDDATLASIPLADKQGMMAAQNEQNIAHEELRKAKSDLTDVDRELDIANNEYKSAKLGKDTAELNQKAADTSGDINRKNQAQRDVHVADLGVKSTDKKVSFLEKKRKWIKGMVDAAEDHITAADAKFELEKARLVASKGMQPSKDFNVTNFETESLDRMKRYSETKLDADKRKPEVDQLEYQWKALDAEWTSAKAH